MKRYFLLSMIVLCLLFFTISPVFAGDPACSFCEFINISKGDPGTNGLNGVNGTSATIAVNYTFTGPPGTSASFINIGDAVNAVFDITIPAGVQGVNGTPGTQGVNGTPGETGPRGIQGVNGTPGEIGPRGIPGTANMTAGPQGVNGTPGYTPVFGVDYFNGSQGIQGVNGTPGETGPQGIQGVNGTPGETGPLGITGMNGTNASVAVNYTFTGLPGTDAVIVNVGNDTSALLDVTIPQGATGDTGASGATGGTGGQILYFRHAASTDPISYEGLISVPAGATEIDESTTLKQSNGQVYIDSYITDIGYPAVTQLPSGLWRFRTFHYVSQDVGTTTFTFKVYNRTAGGTETYLFETTTDDVQDKVVAGEYLSSYVQTTPYSVSLTDRIVVKVYVQTSNNANLVAHWVYEGATHTSHIQTSLETAPSTTLSFSVIAGETLYKGQAVYISGASGGNPQVMKADNTNTAKSRVVGLMVDNTASGANGQVRRAGALTSVDTRNTNGNINPLGQTWSAGDLLFTATGGGLTNVRPTSGRSVKAAYTLAGSSSTDVLLAYPMENPVWVTAALGEDIVLRAGDSSGVNKISIRDYTNAEVGYINSYGNATFTGVDNNNYRLTNVKDPVATQDAATKNYVDTHSSTNLSAIYPIGIVMITSDNVSPAIKLGWGNWSSMGTGYVLVGVP